MTGEERLAEAVKCYLLAESPLGFPYRPGDPLAGSPIERLFYSAIHVACWIGVSSLELVPGTDPKSNCDLALLPQARPLDWPIDYLFTVKSQGGRVSSLAVECDGHEYHERTKEQAARDRDRDRRLQEAGYTVYRFTGSEIYRNAFECARQVLTWAERAAWFELYEKG